MKYEPQIPQMKAVTRILPWMECRDEIELSITSCSKFCRLTIATRPLEVYLTLHRAVAFPCEGRQFFERMNYDLMMESQ